MPDLVWPTLLLCLLYHNFRPFTKGFIKGDSSINLEQELNRKNGWVMPLKEIDMLLSASYLFF